MREVKYENITIEQAEKIMEIKFITELVCDGDNKTIRINEDEYLKAEEAIKEVVKGVINALEPVIDGVTKVYGTIADVVSKCAKVIMNFAEEIAENLSNKKITKKRFIKLLQSQGIQRNEINKIIKNNKEPYTFYRYYNIVVDHQKQNNKQ